MHIENFEIKEQADIVEVSAEVDGFRLWFRTPKSYAVSRTGDPFLAAALLPAMLRGEKLEIDPGIPISPKLLENIVLLQEIHNCWNPILKKIPIYATPSPAEPLNVGTMSFFSGGVDSMYTFLKHTKEISHVVFMHGLDFYLDGETYQAAVERNTAFVKHFYKTLIPVETNHYPFGYRYNLSRNLTVGSALASIALLLGFPRVFIPSSHRYDELMPMGSHPLTDPLYSNECVRIIHDGAEARRVEKTRKIVECALALANLRVCFDNINTNCGKCPKCLRTMIALKLLRASATAFPPLPPYQVIRKMRVKSDFGPIFFKEIFDLAMQEGGKDMRDALYTCMKRHELRQLFVEFDRVILGRTIKRVYRKIFDRTHVVQRISETPPQD